MRLVFTLVLSLVILFSTTTVTNALACPLPINRESSETTYVDLLDRTELLELPRDEQDALDMYRLEVRMRDNHPIMGGEYFVPFVEVENYEEYGLDYEPEERCVYAEDGYGALCYGFSPMPWLTLSTSYDIRYSKLWADLKMFENIFRLDQKQVVATQINYKGLQFAASLLHQHYHDFTNTHVGSSINFFN